MFLVRHGSTDTVEVLTLISGALGCSGTKLWSRLATCCLGYTEAKLLHGNSATLTAVVIMPKVMRQNRLSEFPQDGRADYKEANLFRRW